ncbi:MAG: L-threonylcarbamoyladenylate synthase [Myxococcales bacterium]|jgi:tRNA threonylcarbamoyl adenosine modification protein (Sua5/YciO/YrdC/YwlC family)
MRIEIHPTHPQPRRVHQAVEVLRRGGVIVYPTGTVYGLGCDIHQKKAVERIYQIRRLKKDHPLSFMCPDLSKIARYAHVDDFAYRIMRRLVPGPYTFVLRATRDVPKLLLRKQKTVGIRVPDDKVALALLQELGSPIVSTSATFDGQVLNDPDELYARFRNVDAFVDSGWGGIEPSTVIDLTGDEAVVLREGAGPVDLV